MFSNVKENNISKKCVYNGQLYVELTDKKFSFYPTFGIRQLAIFYDITGSKFEGDTLKMTIKRSTEGPSKITFTLLKLDRSLHEEVIVEVVLETQPLMMDTLTDEYYKFKKSLQMFGAYTITSLGKIMRAVFGHDDGSNYVVLANEDTPIYDCYHWLCGVWTLRCECTQYCISSIFTGVIDESRRLVDCDSESVGTVRFTVAEKCYVHSVTDDSAPLIVPWHKKSSVLLSRVVALLTITVDDLRLLTEKRSVLRDGLTLDIASFRRAATKEPPILWYDVNKTVLKCISMHHTEDSFELVILKDYTGLELKVKLGKELNKDQRSLILCQNDKLMTNDSLISPTTEVKYCMAQPLDGVVFNKSIGQGSFGEVFLCTLTATNEERALKKFTFAIEEEKKRISFIREIVFVLSVPRHNNIVHYYDLRGDGNDLFIEMEYLAEGSLGEYVRTHGQVEEELTRKWSRDILQGLAHLHRVKVNHRDVKGDNVLLTSTTDAKLCDFGISTMLQDHGSRSLADGVQQSRFGTVRYMAPEVINGEPYAFMADIWSVGATIIEMITGKLPHEGCQEDVNIMFQIGNNKRIDYEANISVTLKQLVDACLCANPRDRLSAHCLLELPFFRE